MHPCPCVKVSEPEQLISFHGVAYVDMGPLLYPGATRIRGTYRVHPFSECDLLAKVRGRTGTTCDNTH